MFSADLSFRDSSSKCCEIELFDSLALSLFFFVFSSAARGVTGIKNLYGEAFPHILQYYTERFKILEIVSI